MPGIADLALGAAPIFGGELMGVIAGNLKGPDYRAAIKDDLDLLAKIPPENTALREALQRSIDDRISDLVVTMDKSRELRQSAVGYKGTGEMSSSSSARCCSPWCGGTSTTSEPTGS